MGSLSLLSLNSRDYPVQMALFCFGGALTLGGILLADMLYVVVDPRIKFAKQ
jgi:ABC-type dipeptide/oligopeptide/nickel transport system permease component